MPVIASQRTGLRHGVQADDLIGTPRQHRFDIVRARRGGDDHLSRTPRARNVACRPDGSREVHTVVDDHRDATGQRDSPAVTPQLPAAPAQRCPFRGIDPDDVVVTQLPFAHGGGIDDPGAVLADSGEVLSGMRRHVEPMNQQDIQWRLEMLGDLECDRNTAPRRGEHDGVLADERFEVLRQFESGAEPIGEHPHGADSADWRARPIWTLVTCARAYPTSKNLGGRGGFRTPDRWCVNRAALRLRDSR